MHKNSIVANTPPERIQQVMVYAQLDLAAAIKYALGEYDSLDASAAQKTLQELHHITGDPAGKDLMFIDLYNRI